MVYVYSIKKTNEEREVAVVLECTQDPTIQMQTVVVWIKTQRTARREGD